MILHRMIDQVKAQNTTTGRHPVRDAARRDASQTRDPSTAQFWIPDQRSNIPYCSASGMTVERIA
ncbi:MAG: hypothetical protein GC152_12620 [Alphaproteobacteria bacterium]|nr:hypothetical protein [Alphaproteobacteria bacterium]